MLNVLTPNFLKKTDKYLLINYPDIWATKVHYVAILGSIYFLLLTVVAFAYPLALDNVPNVDILFLILFLISSTFFLFWLYQLSQFKIEANFGNISPKSNFYSQIIYFCVILFLGILPHYFTSIMSYRTRDLVTIRTIKDDIEKINCLVGRVQNDNLGMAPTFISTPSFAGSLGDMYLKAPNVLTEGIKSLNKYISNKGKIEDLQIKTAKCKQIQNECQRNIYAILKAQYHQPHFGREKLSSLLWLFGLILTILLTIFLQVNLKEFLIAAILGISLLFGMSVVMVLIYSFFSPNIMDLLLFSSYMGIWFILGIFAYSARIIKGFATFRQISLILFSIGLSFVPILTGLAFFDVRPRLNSPSFLLLIVGFLFSWGMWNMFFAGKMRHLYSTPKQN